MGFKCWPDRSDVHLFAFGTEIGKEHDFGLFAGLHVIPIDEAAAHIQGKGELARAHIVHVPDMRAIRERLGLSQQAFASAYRIPLAILKGWEQGRRQPDATASAYLSVIAGMPDAAREALRAV